MFDKILLVDDEVDLLTVLKRSLTRLSYVVDTASSAEEAIRAIATVQYDLVVSDLALGGMSGIELLKKIRLSDSLLPFIIMTGVGTIDSAVETIKLGAFHYITKPFNSHELILLIQKAIEHGKLQRKLEFFQEKEEKNEIPDMLIGTNAQVQKIVSTIEKISDADAPVLILGETGTGKSMLARYIHNTSSRKNKDFYIIDCGSLSESLLESELFGHVKGAFTGAVRAKRGLLEEAQGGTIFLDEVGELSLGMQVKLLRTIQEQEIKPVGGNSSIKIDVRFISATNRNLEEDVERGVFRKDLYYRLAVISFHLPALRERSDDIYNFVIYFVNKYNIRYNKKVVDIAPCVLDSLINMPWKGNLRELENAIERAVLLTHGSTITLEVLSLSFPDSLKEHFEKTTRNIPVQVGVSDLKQATELAEISAIRTALLNANGNKSKAAKILGIGRRTLYDKIESYGIK